MLPDVSPQTRALVVATWAFRTRAERESTLRFARLSRELEALGAPAQLVALTKRGARDEHRHAQLCAAMCRRYGGTPPVGRAHDHPATVPGLETRDRLLYEGVAFGCVAETINAQLLTTILRHAQDARVARVVRRLLKDEVVHGQYGWTHLAVERAQGRGAFLVPLLPAMIAGSVEPAIFEDVPEPVTPEAQAHGELPRVLRVEIFASALRETVFPGFESFGLDTSACAAWLGERA